MEPQFNENALAVLRERYLWKDENGNIIETPDDMLKRVAKCVSMAERYDDIHEYRQKFYDMMARLDFLPNSPTLMNAGRKGKHGQLSACYVIGIDDNMESIFDALKKQAIIHKSGGGTGFNFSKLRPEGAIVNSTNGKASGPVSFMRLFNHATDVVQQGGMRRGANMGILNCDHPDVRKFIKAKTEDGKFTNFNISVAVTDAFMGKATQQGTEEYALFSEIVESAWKTGDPGLLFLDTINEKNTTPWLGNIEATNPCGEVPLYSDEACNLGSINLAHMVTENKEVNYDRLYKTTMLAVRFLDDVIDVNNFPYPQIERAVKRTRKIGLGVMGWAEMLFQMNIPYDSVEALNLAEYVGNIIHTAGWEESLYLARERGSFDPEHSKYRNATITCIAPTGTISLLAGCSSGIEPVFALKHKRIAFAEHGVGGKELAYYNPYYAAACISDMSDDDLKRVFVTAHDVSPAWHVRHQAAWQAHTDLAVSKTVNLPHDATVKDVFDVYCNAWSAGCKGVTVYRDGCKATQVLYSLDEKKADVCPVCGAELAHEEGCVKCTSCAWGRCSV